jgi:hypothetical protein
MQFLYSLILAAGGLASIAWCKTLGNLVYQHTQRPLMEDIFTGSWEIPNGPIGRFFKMIGKRYVRLLIPANIVGLIFVGLVLLLAAYGISFGPIQP